jgi:glutamyl-tRNA synthetase
VGRPVALRFRVPEGAITFTDAVQGWVQIDPSRAGGDFVLARWDPKSGLLPGYQLAVVADDAEQGIDTVIRGDDLVPSTPRQILVQRALGLGTPDYAHLPLVVGQDGRRLAKRHGDTRIAAYRAAGVKSRRMLEWIARVSGITMEMIADPRNSRFEWSMVPKKRVVVAAHHAVDGPPPPSS